MNTVGGIPGHSARPNAAEALRARGGDLAARLTVASLIAIASYLIFDFNLIAVVAVPLIVGGIGLASVIFGSERQGTA